MFSLLSLLKQYYAWRYAQYSHMAEVITGSNYTLYELRDCGYFSQCGQDKWLVEKMYPGKHNGVFIDIGAHDGVSFSNTLFLERQLGWTGIAVEPLPDVYARLSENRRCLKINGCISATPGKARFYKITGYSEMLSGLVDQYDPRHSERIKREIEIHGGDIEEIEVMCYRLNSLLEEYHFRFVDYLNIDVEGSEYDILRSIDFQAVDIGVCGIENNYRDYRIPKLMKANGFHFVALVGDEFYVNRSLQRRVSM